MTPYEATAAEGRLLAALDELESLPPEPAAVGSVVGVMGPHHYRVFQLIEVNDHDGYERLWHEPTIPGGSTWAEVCTLTRGAPVPLIPEPAPIPLPWTGTSLGGTPIDVEAEGDFVSATADGPDILAMSPDTAEEAARALWTAAQAVRAKAQTGGAS